MLLDCLMLFPMLLPGDGGVEVDALIERIDLHVGLGGGGEGSLGAFASGSQTTNGTLNRGTKSV